MTTCPPDAPLVHEVSRPTACRCQEWSVRLVDGRAACARRPDRARLLAPATRSGSLPGRRLVRDRRPRDARRGRVHAHRRALRRADPPRRACQCLADRGRGGARRATRPSATWLSSARRSRLGERSRRGRRAGGEPAFARGARELCRAAGLAKVKWPERRRGLAELPRSPSGKLLRGQVAERGGRGDRAEAARRHRDLGRDGDDAASVCAPPPRAPRRNARRLMKAAEVLLVVADVGAAARRRPRGMLTCVFEHASCLREAGSSARESTAQAAAGAHRLHRPARASRRRARGAMSRRPCTGFCAAQAVLACSTTAESPRGTRSASRRCAALSTLKTILWAARSRPDEWSGTHVRRAIGSSTRATRPPTDGSRSTSRTAGEDPWLGFVRGARASIRERVERLRPRVARDGRLGRRRRRLHGRSTRRGSRGLPSDEAVEPDPAARRLVGAVPDARRVPRHPSGDRPRPQRHLATGAFPWIAERPGTPAASASLAASR